MGGPTLGPSGWAQAGPKWVGPRRAQVGGPKPGPSGWAQAGPKPEIWDPKKTKGCTATEATFQRPLVVCVRLQNQFIVISNTTVTTGRASEIFHARTRERLNKSIGLWVLQSCWLSVGWRGAAHMCPGHCWCLEAQGRPWTSSFYKGVCHKLIL